MHQPSKGRIIVFGILFGYPLPGVIYQFLHYLLGLRGLGWNVYYVEDSARWIYDTQLGDLTPDASRNVEAVVPVLEQFGFGERWAFRGAYPGGECYGMSEAQLLRLYGEAECFLNVTGGQEIREEHMICPRRIYVESDPFSSQVKLANGDPGMTACSRRTTPTSRSPKTSARTTALFRLDPTPGCRRDSRSHSLSGKPAVRSVGIHTVRSPRGGIATSM